MKQSFDDKATSHTGFGVCVDATMARRHVRVSIGIVVMLALAIALTSAAIKPQSGWTAPLSKPLQAWVDPSFRHAAVGGGVLLGG